MKKDNERRGVQRSACLLRPNRIDPAVVVSEKAFSSTIFFSTRYSSTKCCGCLVPSRPSSPRGHSCSPFSRDSLDTAHDASATRGHAFVSRQTSPPAHPPLDVSTRQRSLRPARRQRLGEAAPCGEEGIRGSAARAARPRPLQGADGAVQGGPLQAVEGDGVQGHPRCGAKGGRSGCLETGGGSRASFPSTFCVAVRSQQLQPDDR